MPNNNPSPEVKKYFENKGIKPSYSWKDVFESEHAYNFTVAKATEIEVLTTIKEDIQKAIDKGLSFNSYQKIAKERLQNLGWWGTQKQIDPKTGKEELVKVGSNKRLETIFNTNIRTANAAGKWERVQRTKKALPYLQYQLGSARKHREEHLDYADKTLHIDDPFWSTHYPPNGWNCKCWVRQISSSEADKIGVTENPSRSYTEVLNERTQKVEKKYEGVDLGFASNAGMQRDQTLSNFLNDKVENIKTDMSRSIIQDTIKSKSFEQHYLSGNKDNSLYIPTALINTDKAKEQLKVNKNTSVRFSGYTSEKSREKHSDIKQEDYLLVQDIIDKGLLEETEKDKHWVGYTEYDENYYMKAILKKTDKEEIYLQTLFKVKKSRKK